MKIVIASESYYPTISGVAVFSRYLAARLHKRGYEVHVLCPATRFETYDEQVEGIHIHRIRAIKNPFRPKLKVSFFSRAAVEKIIKSVHPDIIHMQDPTSICSEVLRMGTRLNIPMVMTNHFAFDYVLSYLPWLKPLHPFIAKQLERYLLKLYNQCHFITFPSATIRKEFTVLKLHTASEAISNGVNLDQFLPSFNYDEMKQRFSIPNKPVVLHVGRLDQDKKSHHVLEAFIILKKSFDAHLIICGEGNMKKQLQNTVAEKGMTKDVTFIGFIDHQTELPQIYQMATVFTTASTIETQGIVVLEAMASGLPVVAPRAGALPEVVHHNINGFLYEPGNVGEMAKNLQTILQDTKLCSTMGQSSLEMVEEHEIENSIDKFEAIYQRLCSKELE